MGTLTYDGFVVEFEERLLTHLHVVIMQKFRRGESFPMSWVDGQATGDGRSSIWLTPTNPVYFKFDGSRVPKIEQTWIDLLAHSADGPRGLLVLNEDGTVGRSTGAMRRGERLRAVGAVR